MAWVALNCPQCSAPLPRVAIWRTVTCGSCGATITRAEAVVKRESFRQAWLRARASESTGAIVCGGKAYQLLQNIGHGAVSEVYLVRQAGPLPMLATLKLSSDPAAAGLFAREAGALNELHAALAVDAGVLAAQRLPSVVALGGVEGDPGRHALVLRHPSGYWGSLAALHDRFPQGLDPRHGVWIWRRLLDGLHIIHALGWAHGDIRPEHALVHPRDHGILIIGWGAARKGADPAAQAADLMRSARVVQVLLGGASGVEAAERRAPAPFAELLAKTAGDENFCRQHGAAGLDALLRAAAEKAFGPPAFVPLVL